MGGGGEGEKKGEKELSDMSTSLGSPLLPNRL